MADTRPRSPLADRAGNLGQVARLTGGGVTLVEVAPHTQVGIRLDPADAGLVPFALPLEPNTFTGGDRTDVLWLGPDEWLVVSFDADDPIALLRAALLGRHASIVDVSANRAVLDLGGARAAELVSTGCSLDLHPRVWRAGRCAQALLGHAHVILQQRADAIRVFVRPSFSDYLVDWILDAAVAFAPVE